MITATNWTIYMVPSRPDAIAVDPASAKITKKVKAALKMSWLI